MDGVAQFAESFDGYEWCGSVLAAAEHARAKPRRSIEDLRAELFFEFRASRHSGNNEYMETYRQLMWHFLRVARETNVGIELAATSASRSDSSMKGRTALPGSGLACHAVLRSSTFPSVQVNKKSYIELQKEIEALQVESEQRRREEAVEVLARIKGAIATYGFTATELGFTKLELEAGGSQRPAEPSNSQSTCKYRDDKGNSWSGRGPRPAWFQKALANGQRPEDLLST